jgi:hypothetical protein
MKRIPAVFSLIVFTLFLSTNTIHAADDSLGRIVKDSLYGGAAGALVGAASLAFVGKAGDHTENIGRGAAIGVILGAIYGVTKVSGALAEIKDGKIVAGIPRIQLENSTFGNRSLWTVDMVKVSF